MPRSDGPFEILENIGPNAYKVDLPGEYGVSATFNVADLSPYYDENEELPSLRSNSNPLGEDDGDHPSQPFSTPTIDPTTVLEPKRVKEIHALVRNQVYKAEEVVVSSNSFWPGFVCLLEQNSEGQISCTPYQIKA